MKNCFALLFVLSLAMNVVFAQNPNEDKHGNLEIKGGIKIAQSNFEVCSCISNAKAISGVKALTKNEEIAKTSAFVMGDETSSYFVNDNEQLAGNIFFRYEFIIKNGKVEYRFFHFTHEQKDSDFKSIGKLPSEWNESVGVAFNKGQYWEIINAIQTEIASKIQLLSTECFQK